MLRILTLETLNVLKMTIVVLSGLRVYLVMSPLRTQKGRHIGLLLTAHAVCVSV